MSLGASGNGFIPPPDWEDFTYDREDKPPPYPQEAIFEGSYIDAEEDHIISRRNLNGEDRDDSIERGFGNPAYQNPRHNPRYPPYPPHSSHISQHYAPYQPGDGGYGPPPNYVGQNYSTLRCGPAAPQGIHGIRQQTTYPAPIVNDPRSAVTTCLPPGAGQSFAIVQPQVFAVQQSVIAVQPVLEDPPYDYLCYSIFVTFCCCWMLGVRAIVRSVQCRSAIAAGDIQLAEEKSIAARNAANLSLALGILTYMAMIIYGVVYGVLRR